MLPGQLVPPTPACCSRLHASSSHPGILLLQAVHRVSLKKLPFTVLSQPGEQQQQEAGSEDEEQEGGSSGEDDDEDEDEEQPSGDGGSSGSEGEEEEEEDEEEAAPLDAFPSSTAAAVEAFAAAVEADPAAFLQPTAELAGLAKAAAKALYDYQATCQDGASSSGGSAAALPELYIDGFDAEQIWLQLELAAGPALKRARKLLKKAGEEPLLLTPETEEAIDGGLTWAGWQAGWLTCSRFGGGCFRGWWKLALGHAPGQPQWHAACNAFNHSPLICRPLACSLQSCWRVLRVVPATRTMMRLDQGVREMRRMLTWQT